MPQNLDSQLIETVRNLGVVLGDTIRDQLGEEWVDRIDAVRKDGRQAYNGDQEAASRVKKVFSELENEDLLTVGRAFAQFLNLANIAEQEFNSNNELDDPIDNLFSHLDQANVEADTFDYLKKLGVSFPKKVNNIHLLAGLVSAAFRFRKVNEKQVLALEKGKSYLSLDVEVTNEPAIALYTKLGFMKVSQSSINEKMQALKIGLHLHLRLGLI